MGNKKKKKPQQQVKTQEAVVVVAKTEQTDNKSARMVTYGLCGVFFAIGVALMLLSSQQGYGTDLWKTYNFTSYGSVAIGGLILAYGAKFTAQEKQIRIQCIGLVLFMISAGKFLSGWLMQ